MKCIPLENIDDLMQEVAEMCTKSKVHRHQLLEEAPTLASRMERPDKARAVKEYRSLFKTKDNAQ